MLQGARGAVVLTGAGCSTESGVPDYRGPAGAYTTSGFRPMTHQQVGACYNSSVSVVEGLHHLSAPWRTLQQVGACEQQQ